MKKLIRNKIFWAIIVFGILIAFFLLNAAHVENVSYIPELDMYIKFERVQPDKPTILQLSFSRVESFEDADTLEFDYNDNYGSPEIYVINKDTIFIIDSRGENNIKISEKGIDIIYHDGVLNNIYGIKDCDIRYYGANPIQYTPEFGIDYVIKYFNLDYDNILVSVAQDELKSIKKPKTDIYRIYIEYWGMGYRITDFQGQEIFKYIKDNWLH